MFAATATTNAAQTAESRISEYWAWPGRGRVWCESGRHLLSWRKRLREWPRRAQRHTCRSTSGRLCGTRSTTICSATLSLSLNGCLPSTTVIPTHGISWASAFSVQVAHLLPTMSPAAAAISAVPMFLLRVVRSWQSTEKASWRSKIVSPKIQANGPRVSFAAFPRWKRTDLSCLR